MEPSLVIVSSEKQKTNSNDIKRACIRKRENRDGHTPRLKGSLSVQNMIAMKHSTALVVCLFACFQGLKVLSSKIDK